MTTVVLLTFLFLSCALGLAAGVDEDDEATAATGAGAVAGAGVPDRDGSALTVKSLPWASIIELGKVESLVSIACGRRDRASANNALT